MYGIKERYREYSMAIAAILLLALNGAKKAGALALSAVGTLVLKNSGISSVMMIMTVAASANLVLVYAFIRNFGADRR